MSILANLTVQLSGGRDLTMAEVEAAAHELASVEGAEEIKADFLTALAKKGESVAEVAGFARAFRDRAIDPGVSAWASTSIDIVGTGGDHAGGFNISSIVVLVLASAGVKVMKHGNRGITSRCGSADLLAGLGVNLQAPAETLRNALEELGFVFFFAPNFHPAFKNVAPARKVLAARGQRSIFNILGPLINPGRPAHVLLGVFSQAWVGKLAGALDSLGVGAGLAVHGIIDQGRGIDEFTTATPNRVQGFGRLKELSAEWAATDFGLEEAPFADLRGGDLAENLATTQALLAGRGPRGLVDTITVNAAIAMWIMGRCGTIREGIEAARELLLGGAVEKKIAATRAFYAS